MKTAYCFDLDSTITKQEILPLIAKEADLFEEIKALTEATLKGVLPFERSFLLRCRLLKEVPIEIIRNIIFNIELHPQIVDFIRNNKENSFIITGNLDVWIEKLVTKFGCKVYSSKGLVENNRLINVEQVLDKAAAVKEIRKNYSRIISVGDGMGDVRMFEVSDKKIAFGGTHPPVNTIIKLSDYVTYGERGLCNILNTL